MNQHQMRQIADIAAAGNAGIINALCWAAIALMSLGGLGIFGVVWLVSR